MADSFGVIVAVPTKPGKIEVVLHVTPGTPNEYAAFYQYDILDATGNPIPIQQRKGNLIPHAESWLLTAAHKTALAACTDVADVQKLLMDLYALKAKGSIGA